MHIIVQTMAGLALATVGLLTKQMRGTLAKNLLHHLYLVPTAYLVCPSVHMATLPVALVNLLAVLKVQRVLLAVVLTVVLGGI